MKSILIALSLFSGLFAANPEYNQQEKIQLIEAATSQYVVENSGLQVVVSVEGRDLIISTDDANVDNVASAITNLEFDVDTQTYCCGNALDECKRCDDRSIQHACNKRNLCIADNATTVGI